MRGRVLVGSSIRVAVGASVEIAVAAPVGTGVSMPLTSVWPSNVISRPTRKTPTMNNIIFFIK